MTGPDVRRAGDASVNHFAKVAGDNNLQKLMTEAVAAVRAAEGSLLLLDHAGGKLRFVIVCSPAAQKLLNQEVPLDQSITGLAVSLQQPMIVNDVQQCDVFFPGTDARTGTITESLMAVPLSTPAHEFGAMTAINARSKSGFSSADLETYEEFAARICERLTSLDLDMGNAGPFE